MVARRNAGISVCAAIRHRSGEQSEHRRVTLVAQAMQAQGNHGATKKPSPEDWNNGKTDDAHRLAARRCSNGSHWRKRWRGHAQHVKKQSVSTEIAFDGNRVGHRTQRVFHATWCEMNGERLLNLVFRGRDMEARIERTRARLPEEDKGSGNKGTALPGGSGHWPVTRTGSVEKVSPSVAAPFGRGKLLNTVRQGRSIVRQAPLRNPHGGTSGQGETIA